MLKITLTEKQLSYAKAMGKKRHSYDKTLGVKGAYNISKKDNDSDHIDIPVKFSELINCVILVSQSLIYSPMGLSVILYMPSAASRTVPQLSSVDQKVIPFSPPS